MKVLNITDEMIQRAYRQIQAQARTVPVVLIEDERPRMTERARKRMEDRGLQFPLPAGPLTVILEDDVMHTVDFPVCNDPTCICQRLEREQIIAETTPRRRRRRNTNLVNTNCEAALGAPLNGNRGFSLLR